MNRANDAELLACRNVAVDTVARQIAHLDSPVAFVLRPAAALWHVGASRVSRLSFGRVRAATASPMEQAGQGAVVLRSLRRQALQANRRAPMGNQRTSDCGSLHSAPRE